MRGNYTIWLCRPTGERVALLSPIVHLTYRRAVNRTGFWVDEHGQRHWPLTLILAADDLPKWVRTSFQRDWQLEVWRQTGSGLLELDTETIWLIARVSHQVLEDGLPIVEVKAVPALALLERRIVAYANGTPQTQKYGAADDVMRAIMRENFGSAASPARDVSTWLRIPPPSEDLHAGAVVSKNIAYRRVLEVLQELATASAEQGIPLFFDVVCRDDGLLPRLQFATYSQVRGTNLARGNSRGYPPLILSAETGSLIRVRRTQDWSNQITAVYVAGQGAKTTRQLVEISDDERAGMIPFGRSEALVDARHTTVMSDLAYEGLVALQTGRAQDDCSGYVVSREPSFVYGRDWRFGDRVSVEFQGETIDCQVDAIQVVVDPDREVVIAEIRGNHPPTLATGRQYPSSFPASVAAPRVRETEHTFQQIQQLGVPEGEYLLVPEEGQLIALGCYQVAGIIDVAGEVRIGA